MVTVLVVEHLLVGIPLQTLLNATPVSAMIVHMIAVVAHMIVVTLMTLAAATTAIVPTIVTVAQAILD